MVKNPPNKIADFFFIHIFITFLLIEQCSSFLEESSNFLKSGNVKGKRPVEVWQGQIFVVVGEEGGREEFVHDNMKTCF